MSQPGALPLRALARAGRPSKRETALWFAIGGTVALLRGLPTLLDASNAKYCYGITGPVFWPLLIAAQVFLFPRLCDRLIVPHEGRRPVRSLAASLAPDWSALENAIVIAGACCFVASLWDFRWTAGAGLAASAFPRTPWFALAGFGMVWFGGQYEDIKLENAVRFTGLGSRSSRRACTSCSPRRNVPPSKPALTPQPSRTICSACSPPRAAHPRAG